MGQFVIGWQSRSLNRTKDIIQFFYVSDILKSDDGNPILNTERKRKPSSASFSASYGPTRFTLLWQLEVTVRKLQQQGELCWSIGFGEISRNRLNIGFLASHFLSWTCSSASSTSSPSYFFLFCSFLLPFFMLPLFYLLIWFKNLYIS